ncbi:MAG: hypothetical protein U0894_12835 [Pirellulales bacterium]
MRDRRALVFAQSARSDKSFDTAKDGSIALLMRAQASCEFFDRGLFVTYIRAS